MSNLLEAQNSGMGRYLMVAALVAAVIADLWIAFLSYVISVMTHEGGSPVGHPAYWAIVAALVLSLGAPVAACSLPLKLKWRLAVALVPLALLALPVWLSSRF